MPKDLAIVLNNGGINSAVVTAMAAQKYRPVMLHAEMVQGGGSRMRAAYDQQVSHFKPYREHSLAIPWAMALANPGRASSAAVDTRQIGAVQQQLLELAPLVAMAARFAAHYDAATIYIGLRVGPEADDLAAATEYLQIWNEMMQLPCGQPELEVIAPLLELEQWQVVDVGFQVNAPFDRTWSCAGETSEPCWSCRGCRNREQAFQQAGKPDPLKTVRKL